MDFSIVGVIAWRAILFIFLGALARGPFIFTQRRNDRYEPAEDSPHSKPNSPFEFHKFTVKYVTVSSLIRDISDTARWVAIFRADESERPDAVFHDPYARKLAGERGEQIANTIEFSSQNSWSFVARTYAFDAFINEAVANGFDMVINLAAGLDTRPYRMDLPANLKWIEIDFSRMLDYKSDMLKNEKPTCELSRI